MKGSERKSDPYLLPQTTPGNRLARLLWQCVYILLFRTSPRPMHAWRAFLLRCFGARVGPYCHIYPGSRIWAPWQLECDDSACIADGAYVYNVAKVHLGSHAIVSQDAFVCTASHDIDDPRFPMISAAIRIGDFAWICARACVMPGVTVSAGAVLGLASVATEDLDAWTVYAGMPARRIKPRAHDTPR
jgi:putative colanic acid biosynthesis acetyltransferase WcaF